MPLIGRASVRTEVINEFMTDTIINLSKTCAAKANNKIDISAQYVGGSVVFTDKAAINQTAEADIRCEQTSDLQAAVRSEMSNKIKQSAMTTDNNIFSGDIGWFSETNASNYMLNKTILSSDLKDVMVCMADASNEIKAQFAVIMRDLKFEAEFNQTARAKVSNCVQGTKWAQNITNKYNNDIEQSARSVGTVVGLAAEAGDILSKVMTGVIISAVCGALVYFSIKFSKKKKVKAPAAVAAPAFSDAMPSAPSVQFSGVLPNSSDV
jgi:hypothetical protein